MGTRFSVFEWYRYRMAWPVTASGKDTLLPLGNGIVAFGTPVKYAASVRKYLERDDVCTPTLITGGEEPQAVFLAQADSEVLGQHQMPAGVRYLTVPTVLLLPRMSFDEETRWYCPPYPARRWLSSAAAVLTAVILASPKSVLRIPSARRIAD